MSNGSIGGMSVCICCVHDGFTGRVVALALIGSTPVVAAAADVGSIAVVFELLLRAGRID